MSEAKMKLYAVSGSQPCRAVMWLLHMHGIPYDLIKTVPPVQTRTSAFRKMTPQGSIPVLDDNGFILWDSAVIMRYLCEKYQWTDVYPADKKKQYLIDLWLHFHHRHTREVQLAYNMPLMRPDLAKLGLWAPVYVLTAKNALNLIDKHLAQNKFFAGEFSIADIQIYQDVGQCQKKYIGSVDFTPYPNIRRWMRDIETVNDFAYVDKIHQKVAKWMKKMKQKNQIDSNKKKQAKL